MQYKSQRINRIILISFIIIIIINNIRNHGKKFILNLIYPENDRKIYDNFKLSVFFFHIINNRVIVY